MKVFHCLKCFLPDNIAGTEIYVAELAKALIISGVESKVVIPAPEAKQLSSYWYEGIEVLQYPEPSVVDRALIMGKRIPEGVGSFIRLLKSEMPDIVHFHEITGSNGITLAHLEAVRHLKIKVVTTLHLPGYACKTGNMRYMGAPCDGKINPFKCTSCFLHSRGFSPAFSNALTSAATPFYKANVNLSKLFGRGGSLLSTPFHIRQHEQNLNKIATTSEKIIVLAEWFKKVLILNGVEEDKLRQISQALPGKIEKEGISKRRLKLSVGEKIKLVFVGRISPVKGIHLILEALQNISTDKVSLDLYGASTDEEYLRHCRELSQDLPNVKWCGKLKPSQIITTLGQYHLLCLPSIFGEMAPLVIQEAFAAGIPVIASDVPGNAEPVRHQVNGLLFKAADAMALKKELLKLIESPALLHELSLNISPPKSFDKVAKEHVQLYEELGVFTKEL